MGAVVTSAVFTNCDTEWNAAVVSNAAMEDPAFTVRVVTEGNDTSIVPLGDSIFVIALDDPRVFPVLDISVLISPLGGPTFIVAADNFSYVVALNDTTLTAEVL